MNEVQYNELLETSWRRSLTEAETLQVEEYLVQHPELREASEADLALSRELSRITVAPLSSNFTSQVMNAVHAEIARESGHARHATRWGWSWGRLWPRLAFATVFSLLSMGGFFQYKTTSRAAMARDLVMITDLMAQAGPEALIHFDAIRTLPPTTDDDLLAALQ